MKVAHLRCVARTVEGWRVAGKRTAEVFSGRHTVRIPREGYDDYVTIPACPQEAVLEAVGQAVEHGIVWLINTPATAWKEALPAASLNEKAGLHSPPDAVTPQDLMADTIPAMWKDHRTNDMALIQALSHERSTLLPWGIVRDGIGAAVNNRWLVLAEGSGPCDCEYGQAVQLILKQPKVPESQPLPSPPSGTRTNVLDAFQIQDLADQVSDLLAAAGGNELRFYVGVKLEGEVTEKTHAKVDAVRARVFGKLKSGSAAEPRNS